MSTPDLVFWFRCLLDLMQMNCCSLNNLSLILGEVLLSVSGRVGADDYREVRMFKVVDSSTTITFVFIASLFNGNVITSVPSCGDASSARPYDVIMCCSYMSDMNRCFSITR